MNFPDKEGKIEEIYISEGQEYPIVLFEGKKERVCYNFEGCLSDRTTKTLSTKPYKVEFQGFEQKASAPTYEEAVKWLESTEGTEIMNDSVFLAEGNYYTNLDTCAEALKKLILLRDYYNEGWQPDWNDNATKYSIEVEVGEIVGRNHHCNARIMSFKTNNVRNKFLEDQRELLEIAKPLL
ncbi:hypothetical protein [uncultured Capnocytophaga sp.]|uniref:hypothetical protein n=1 Tax=uncultured Capnocytophaga sp. TaxID=159273 RepID=UPI0028F0CBBC|nr:hypothetical protein [uncultured Capnocytophaga sp.]